MGDGRRGMLERLWFVIAVCTA
jgi:hypothetical protein